MLVVKNVLYVKKNDDDGIRIYSVWLECPSAAIVAKDKK